MKKVIVLITMFALMAAMIAGCGSASGPSTAPAQSSGDAAAATTTVAAKTADTAANINWPSGKSINVIVPAKAGGGTDLLARYITGAWDTLLDASFVVTNYETSEVGNQTFNTSKTDGMTLSLAACTSMDAYLSGTSEVNPKDYTVIAKITAGNPQVLFTNANAPYSNMKELQAYAKEHPKELICGVALGGTSQLVWINIASKMGIELNYVQSGNEADKLTNVAAGSINLGNCSLNNAKDYEAAGKIKILGILSYSDKVGKNDIEPELSDKYLTTWEQGFPGTSWYSGLYIVGPPGMDKELAKAINKSIQGIANVDSFKDGMKKMRQVIEIKDVDGSLADYMDEWEAQVALTKAAGINVR